MGRARSELAVRLLGHRMHAGSVNPAIVEVEQRAHRDGVIDGFVRPAGLVKRLRVVKGDLRRVMVDFADEAKQRLVLFRKPRTLKVLNDAADQIFISQQFRRNCGVVFCSKGTMIGC